MEISYGIMCRRNRQKKPPFNLPPFLWRAPCPIRPIAEQALWCNNPQRYEISDDPRKQLRSPRCLRIVSGHRELSTDVPGRKSLVLTSALARRPRSSVLV